MAVISATKLGKKYGDFSAINDLNLEIRQGEIYGFLGPNGAGKTTTLRILTGQIQPTNGESMVLGVDPAKEPLEVRAKVAIVPEDEYLPSFLTVNEYLEYVARVRTVPSTEIAAKIQHWLEFFNIPQKTDVLCTSLSRGEKHKVMVAAAMIGDQKALFLDEPLSGFDPISQKDTIKLFKNYASAGGTIFMCTHLLDLASKMCTRCGIISHGELVSELKKPSAKALESAFNKLVKS